MKKLFLAALFFLCSLSSFASVPAGTGVRLLYSTANVTGAGWITLINTTARYVEGVYFSNSGQDPLGLGMAPANSATNSEVIQAVIPASGSGSFLLPIPGAYRVSVISLGKANTTGELDFNVIFH